MARAGRLIENKAVYTAALVADGWAGEENLKKQLCDGWTDGQTVRKELRIPD